MFQNTFSGEGHLLGFSYQMDEELGNFLCVRVQIDRAAISVDFSCIVSFNLRNLFVIAKGLDVVGGKLGAGTKNANNSPFD